MTEVPASGTERAEHWDAAYQTHGATGVSWFQPAASTSLEIIGRIEIARNAAIIDIGGGASMLCDALLDREFTDVSVLDVSKTALAAVHQRLGNHPSLSLLQEDLLTWSPERRYDLWHDRAVFHFLVDPSDRATYLQALHSALSPDGFVIMATFASDGPEFCSGLPVARYSSATLAKMLGPQFQVIEAFQDEHVTPAGGQQPFTWMVARLHRPRWSGED